MKDYKALQNGSDIRGIAMEVAGGKPVDLTDEAIADLGRGFVRWLSERCGKAPESLGIAVGRDSRITGPHIQKVLCEALGKAGASVLDC